MPTAGLGRSTGQLARLAARIVLILSASTLVNVFFGLFVLAVVTGALLAALAVGLYLLDVVSAAVLLGLSALIPVVDGALAGGWGPLEMVVGGLLETLAPLGAVLGRGLEAANGILSSLPAIATGDLAVDLGMVVYVVGALVVLVIVLPVYMGPEMLIRDLDGHVVDAEAEPRLVETLRRVAVQSGVPTPRVAVVDSVVPRSFAAGRKGNGTVVVTTELLDALDDRELEAVLAHEVSHILNRDALVFCYTAYWSLFFALTEDVGFEGSDEEETDEEDLDPVEIYAGITPVSFAGYADRSGPVGLVGRGLYLLDAGIGLVISVILAIVYLAGLAVFYVLFPIMLVLAYPVLGLAQHAGVMLSASLSRTREFAADRGAVAITGDPAALASALAILWGIDPAETDLRTVEAVEPMSILPIEHRDPEGLIGRLRFRTHPPTEERIERLRVTARRQET